MKISINAYFDDFAKELDAKTIRKTFRKVVIDEGREVKRLYDGIQSHFTSKNRVKFRQKTGSGRSPVDGQGGTIYSAVGTDQDRGAVIIWLEDGTKNRYRTMSADWVSKTSPGGGLMIGSGRGIAMGWDFINHREIQPRYFRDDIVRTRTPTFESHADTAFAGMLKAARWI